MYQYVLSHIQLKEERRQKKKKKRTGCSCMYTNVYTYTHKHLKYIFVYTKTKKELKRNQTSVKINTLLVSWKERWRSKHVCIRQTERRFSKKDWLIGQFFVRKVGVVGVLLNVSMLVYVTWITRTYIRMFVYILASIFTYIHIFFSSLILPNFMIVKGLLDANTKCLFLWWILLSDADD